MRYRTVRNLKDVLLTAMVMMLGVIPVSAQDHATCPMMAKKDHRAEVDHRHDAVSGVRHEGAVHHFLLAPDGGTIRLETKDGSRPGDRDRIRTSPCPWKSTRKLDVTPAGKRALLLDALEGLVEPGHPSPMVPAPLRRKRRPPGPS